MHAQPKHTFLDVDVKHRLLTISIYIRSMPHKVNGVRLLACTTIGFFQSVTNCVMYTVAYLKSLRKIWFGVFTIPSPSLCEAEKFCEVFL